MINFLLYKILKKARFLLNASAFHYEITVGCIFGVYSLFNYLSTTQAISYIASRGTPSNSWHLMVFDAIFLAINGYVYLKIIHFVRKLRDYILDEAKGIIQTRKYLRMEESKRQEWLINQYYESLLRAKKLKKFKKNTQVMTF